MKSHALLTAAFTWLASLAAGAATLSTLSLTDAGYDVVSWNTWKGQSFHVSAQSPASLVDTLTLKLEVVVPNANMVLRILANTPGMNTPDTTDIRGEFRPVHPMLAGNAVMLLTFERNAQQSFPPLEADSTYWLVAGMTAPDEDQLLPAGVVRWHYAATHPAAPGNSQQWGVGQQVAFSGTAGSAWSSSVETPFLFDLIATPIPEPGSALLLTAAALLLNRRRRP